MTQSRLLYVQNVQNERFTWIGVDRGCFSIESNLLVPIFCNNNIPVRFDAKFSTSCVLTLLFAI